MPQKRWTAILALTALVAHAACSPDDPGYNRPDGDSFIDAVDGTDMLTDSDVPADVPFSCTPGEWGCYGNIYYQCGPDGVSRINEIVCEHVCDEELGCVLCHPGERYCEGTISMICAPDGQSWYEGRDCEEWGSVCGPDGYCSDACGEAEKTNSYVGCEYWPVPLTNTTELDATVFDYRVIVGNPNDVPVNVTVTRAGSEVASELVDAGGLAEIALPWIDGQSFAIGGDDWSSLAVANGAYRLISDRPVTVSQFNPFEYNAGGVFSYTNDATLLLPAHVLTGDYLGLSYVPFSRATGTTGPFPTPPSFYKYPDYIAVVGIKSTPTNVEVWAAGHVAGETSGRFADAARGSLINFTLQRGEVVHVAADTPPNCVPGRPGFSHEEDCTMGICDYLDTCREIDFDLTGSRIRADQPVAVFGGHVCSYVPYTSQAYDHLEVQLAPIQTWGTEYVTAPMRDAGTTYPNLVRVVAAFDGTEVTLSPPQDGLSTFTLNEFTFREFFASSPFQITGSRAILVGQFLLGQYFPEPDASRGDPAMTMLVPSAQYREDYVFVTPTSYNPTTNGQSYVMIVRPPGLDLVLDGATLSVTWESVGGMEIGTVAVEGGTHTISGADAFGMITFGMGSFTSYAYPAGLNLEQITTII